MFLLLDKKNRALLKGLIRTDFKLRYQQSVIGYLWSILYPLLYFAVLYFVFVKFLRFGAGTPNWAVAMLLGTVIWTFFDEATNRSMRSVVNRGDLLRKVHFPKTVLIYAEVAGAAINFMINLVVVFLFMLINGVHPSLEAFLILPLVLELLLVTLGISFMLATVYVKFRDIEPIWGVVMQLGFFSIPIIYPLSQISISNPLISKMIMLNPLAQIISDARRVMLGSHGGIYPSTFDFILNKGIALVPYGLVIILLIVGYFVYTRRAEDFAEVL